MSKHKIKFLSHNKEITVMHGENLIRAALEVGVHINASCGGDGATLLSWFTCRYFTRCLKILKKNITFFKNIPQNMNLI